MKSDRETNRKSHRNFYNSAITQPLVCARIMVEMVSRLDKNGPCSISQLLS